MNGKAFLFYDAKGDIMLDDTLIFRISLIQFCPVKNNSVANRRNNCYVDFFACEKYSKYKCFLNVCIQKGKMSF